MTTMQQSNDRAMLAFLVFFVLLCLAVGLKLDAKFNAQPERMSDARTAVCYRNMGQTPAMVARIDSVFAGIPHCN